MKGRRALVKAVWDGLSALWSDRRGAATTILAVTLPVMILGSGAATQYAFLIQQKTTIQQAADAAALGAAKELQLANGSVAHTIAVANGIATAELSQTSTDAGTQVQAAVVDGGTGVDVTITRLVTSFFSNLLGTGYQMVRGHSRAHSFGSALPICVIGLDPFAKGTVSLDTNAVVQAPGCAVYSDSNHPWAIASVANAVLKTGLTCAVGGKLGNYPNFSPQPKSGCPSIPDPLSSRAPPPFAGCDYTLGIPLLPFLPTTLHPGVYCGGLTISGPYNVTLIPGVYIMKDGPLVIGGGASVTGINVGLFLTGTNATLTFGASSTISLTAPKDGPMAGLLVYEDRNNAIGALHQILSNNAQVLLGTLYLPRGRLFVGANAPVASNSAYTVIVADKLELSAGPTLVLNANYDATDIPVPAGVGPHSGSVSLSD